MLTGYEKINGASQTIFEFDNTSNENPFQNLETGTYKYVGVGNTVYVTSAQSPANIQHVDIFNTHIEGKVPTDQLFAGFIYIDNDIPGLGLVSLNNTELNSKSESIQTKLHRGYKHLANANHKLLLEALESSQLQVLHFVSVDSLVPLNTLVEA